MKDGQKEYRKKRLKPCPFCGGESRLLLNAKRKIYGKDEYRTGVVACCNVCEARMFYGSEKLAIEAWNRRADEQPEIIRCKDCKHWKKTIGDERWSLGDCDVFDKKLVMCEGFCSWGVRREENDG